MSGYLGLTTGNNTYAEGSGNLDAMRFQNGIGASAWTQKANLTHAAADIPGVVYNGKLYIFGGYGTSSTDYLNYTQIYDPSTNTWSQGTVMPTARWGAAAAVVNGKIYVFGGKTSGGNSAKCEIYDIAGNSWTTGTDIPSAIRDGSMAVTVGGYIYLFYLGNTWLFDPSGNGGLGSYTAKTAPPVNKVWATCGYVNVSGEDRIYIIAGYDNVSTSYNSNYYYKPTTNDWSSAQAPAPYTARGMTRDNPVYNGLIYFGFGLFASPFYDGLFAYNPSTDKWYCHLGPSILGGRDGIACGFIGSQLYCVGGRNSVSTPVGLNYNEYFDVGVNSANITDIEIRYNQASPSGSVHLGIYAEDAYYGTPSILVLDAGAVIIANGWVTITGLSIPIGYNAWVWLVFDQSAANGIYYQTGEPAGSHGYAAQAYGVLPNPCPTLASNTNQYVMRAYVVTELSAPINDQININENVTGAVVSSGLSATIYDTINASELVSPLLPFCTVTLFDTVNVSESVTRLLILAWSVYDTVNVSESVTPSLVTSLSAYDTVGVSELVTPLLPFQAASVYDTVRATEQVSPYLAVTASLYDTVNVAETVIGEVISVAPVTATVYDTIDVRDEVTPTVLVARSLLDTVNVSEQVTPTLLTGILTYDSVTVNELVAPDQLLSTTTYDTVTSSESVTPLLPFVGMTLYETVNVTENLLAAVPGVALDVSIYDVEYAYV